MLGERRDVDWGLGGAMLLWSAVPRALEPLDWAGKHCGLSWYRAQAFANRPRRKTLSHLSAVHARGQSWDSSTLSTHMALKVWSSELYQWAHLGPCKQRKIY